MFSTSTSSSGSLTRGLFSRFSCFSLRFIVAGGGIAAAAAVTGARTGADADTDPDAGETGPSDSFSSSENTVRGRFLAFGFAVVGAVLAEDPDGVLFLGAGAGRAPASLSLSVKVGVLDRLAFGFVLAAVGSDCACFFGLDLDFGVGGAGGASASLSLSVQIGVRDLFTLGFDVVVCAGDCSVRAFLRGGTRTGSSRAIEVARLGPATGTATTGGGRKSSASKSDNSTSASTIEDGAGESGDDGTSSIGTNAGVCARESETDGARDAGTDSESDGARDADADATTSISKARDGGREQGAGVDSGIYAAKSSSARRALA